MHALTVGTHIVRNNSIKKNSMCHQKFAPSFRFWKVFFRSFNVHISQKYNSHQFKCTFWWISDQNLLDPPVATITNTNTDTNTNTNTNTWISDQNLSDPPVATNENTNTNTNTNTWISDQNLSDPPVATAERPVVLGGDGCTLELVCNADGELFSLSSLISLSYLFICIHHS